MSDKSDLDDAAAPDSGDVFAFGDSTILQMRNQPFRVGEDQYGTMMSTPLPDVGAAEPETPEAMASVPSDGVDDPLARLERKLDMALRHIDALQHRLESIDGALARVLNR
jgi:hypothetical protein